MKLFAKIGLLSLLAGGTATVVYGDPVGGWLSPNGTSGASMAPAAPTSSSNGPVNAVGSYGATGQMGGAGNTGNIAGNAGFSMTLGELQARVHLLHEQTRADARHVAHLQLVARKEKDVIKLNCVNDKLVQLKPQMNMADAGEAELDSARDSDRLGIFDSISQAADNVRRLREEADQCIGEPIGTGGESSNSFTGPTLPDDPTKGFTGNQIEPPGYASPYN